MAKKKIAVRLLNRHFTVVVDEKEEQDIKASIQAIEGRLKELKEQFQGVDDTYPILMCCVELAYDNLLLRRRLEQQSEQMMDEVAAILSQLE